MDTKIFENIIDNHFEGKTPSKGNSYTQKSDFFEFRNLIKDQTSKTKTNNSESELKKQKTTKHENVSETSSPKQDSNDYADVPQSSAIAALSTIEKMTSVADTKDSAIQEEVIIEEKYILQGQELDQFDNKSISAIFLPEEHDKTAELLDSADEERVVTPIPAFNLDTAEASENINDKTTPVVSEPLAIPKLSDENLTAQQHLKTSELPNDITKVAELPTDKLQSLPQSQGISELEALSAKLEAPIKLVIEDESRKNITDNTKPIIITPSLNLTLADTTKRGKEVISKMQALADDHASTSVPEAENFILDNEASFFNLSDKDNNNAGQKKSVSLEAFGTTIEQTKDGAFEITFEGHNKGLRHSETPKPMMQVSLAVNEVLNSNLDSGKKQITINLHPHTLGSVKVEILSQMGHDGVSKIETIKISADKHETLVMLEERKADLSKSLKEVNGAQEKETSLQFEMSQDQGKGQGAYFSSIEERSNWMSKFAGLISDAPIDENQIHIIDEYATRGIVTEDKVDLIA